MIELIKNLPDNILGLRAHGQVTADDYTSTVIPAVESRFALMPRLRLLYHFGEDFEGFDAQAMMDDTWLGLRHLGGWERVAVVTDKEWLRGAAYFFGFTSKLKVFHEAQMDAARQWLAEPAEE